MTTTQILIVGLGAIGVFAVLGAFVIAFRRGASGGGQWQDSVARSTRKADRSQLDTPVAVAADAAPDATDADEADGAVDEGSAPIPAMAGAPAMAAVEVVTVEELSPEEAGVSRRMFLTRALGGVFGAFLGLFGLTSLAFVWPRLSGGFGSNIDVGAVEDLHAQIVQADGSIIPAFIPEARAYVVPFNEAALAGSQFSDNVVADGLTALFQRCVHLGCRVPWCASSQGFECPCHGSKYNFVGEYQAGPAPRNLDRFEVELQGNRLIVKTSRIIQTPRATADTVPYPQGPSCISLTPVEG
jgi:cytochrome b6-f complex iron-sulfur subunit